jgi:glycosyltransferase involved in cell wall biosynthesis
VSRIRILVDAAIVKPQLGGIATYAAGVVSGLAEQDGVSVSVATSVPELFDFPGVDLIELPVRVRGFAARALWRERALARVAAASGADVLFTPTIELPLLRRPPLPAIAVVLDIGPIVAPALHGGALRRLRYLVAARVALPRASHIICISETTRASLERSLGALPVPISVIGAAPRMIPVLARAPREPPYILSVGAALPHKNLETLIAAMDEEPLLELSLVLAGPLDEHERARIEAACARVRRPERIVHRGFVSAQELAELYAGAALVALPTLSEGFGLPLVEAMRAGVPVLASAIPVLREVGGDGAVYVEDPLRPREWAGAVASLLADPDRLARLASAGSELAARFSWPAIGAQIAAIAREIA